MGAAGGGLLLVACIICAIVFMKKRARGSVANKADEDAASEPAHYDELPDLAGSD